MGSLCSKGTAILANQEQECIDSKGLLLLPDELLISIFLLLNSAQDRTKLASTCQRLRQLAFTEQSIWLRFRRIQITCCYDDNQQIGLFRILSDREFAVIFERKLATGFRRRMQAALEWIFGVCRPTYMSMEVANLQPDSVSYFAAFINTLPPRDSPKWPQRFELHISTRNLPMFDILPINIYPAVLDRLFRSLPTEVTHLRFRLRNLKAQTVAPIFVNWLRDCRQVQVFWCEMKNVDNYEVMLASQIKDWVKSRVLLRAIWFRLYRLELNWMIPKLLFPNKNCSSTLLCCELFGNFGVMWLQSQLLSKWTRANITTICCLDVTDVTDVSFLPELFPNCREIRVVEKIPDFAFSELCGVYGNMRSNIEENVLRIIEFVFCPSEDSFVRLGLVEKREQLSMRYNRCAIRSEFD